MERKWLFPQFPVTSAFCLFTASAARGRWPPSGERGSQAQAEANVTYARNGHTRQPSPLHRALVKYSSVRSDHAPLLTWSSGYASTRTKPPWSKAHAYMPRCAGCRNSPPERKGATLKSTSPRTHNRTAPHKQNRTEQNPRRKPRETRPVNSVPTRAAEPRPAGSSQLPPLSPTYYITTPAFLPPLSQPKAHATARSRIELK